MLKPEIKTELQNRISKMKKVEVTRMKKSYQAYNAWRDKLDVRNKNYFRERLSEEEYYYQYTNAKALGLPNIARTIARSDRAFSQKQISAFKKAKINVEGTTKEEREAAFMHFASRYDDFDEGRAAFEALY